jgi:DNA-binding MarR family transcriptional regulator
MKRHLQEELQQSKPFPTLEEEVVVELQRTAQLTARRIALALRPWGLSESQFNVLRILRGCAPDGLSSTRIGERMVRYDPDLTRLVDQLEKRGLVEKRRDTRDRRVVNSRITGEGLRLVEAASRELREAMVGTLRHMGADRLERLADLLELARNAGAADDPGEPSSSGRARSAPSRPESPTRKMPTALPGGRVARRSGTRTTTTPGARSRRSP